MTDTFVDFSKIPLSQLTVSMVDPWSTTKVYKGIGVVGPVHGSETHVLKRSFQAYGWLFRTLEGLMGFPSDPSQLTGQFSLAPRKQEHKKEKAHFRPNCFSFFPPLSFLSFFL